MMGDKDYLTCRVPRVKNSLSQITSVPVPWADDGERHTHDFEDYAIKVLQATHNQTKAGELLDVSYEKINRVMYNSVERGLTRRNLSADTIISEQAKEKSVGGGQRPDTAIHGNPFRRSIYRDAVGVGQGGVCRYLPAGRQVWVPFLGAIKKSVRRLTSCMTNSTWLPILTKA